MFWPFSRVWPTGLVNNQVPTHTDLNKLDEQQAQAADGAVWSDVAAAANMPYLANPGWPGAGAGIGSAVWSDLLGCWYVTRIVGSALNIFKAYPPFVWGESFEAETVPVGSGFIRVYVVCNPAGVALAGGTPTALPATKLRRTSGGSATWTQENTPTNLSITGLGWFQGAGLFLAGYGSGTAIDTSPDGITWTTRTSSNSDARGVMAASPTRLVWAPAVSATVSNLVTTDDGVAFTQRAIGVSAQWAGVTYSAPLGKWFLISVNGNVLSSSDGITWTATPTTVLDVDSVVAIVNYGRALFAVCHGSDDSRAEIWCSLDGAASFRKIAKWLFDSAADVSDVAVGPGGQLYVASGAAGQARFGLRLGL